MKMRVKKEPCAGTQDWQKVLEHLLYLYFTFLVIFIQENKRKKE